MSDPDILLQTPTENVLRHLAQTRSLSNKKRREAFELYWAQRYKAPLKNNPEITWEQYVLSDEYSKRDHRVIAYMLALCEFIDEGRSPDASTLERRLKLSLNFRPGIRQLPFMEQEEILRRSGVGNIFLLAEKGTELLIAWFKDEEVPQHVKQTIHGKVCAILMTNYIDQSIRQKIERHYLHVISQTPDIIV